MKMKMQKMYRYTYMHCIYIYIYTNNTAQQKYNVTCLNTIQRKLGQFLLEQEKTFEHI